MDSPTWTDVVAPDDDSDDDGDDEWGAITVVDSGWKGNGGRCRLGTVFQLTRQGNIIIPTSPRTHLKISPSPQPVIRYRNYVVRVC